jgi:hypothetical protein
MASRIRSEDGRCKGLAGSCGGGGGEGQSGREARIKGDRSPFWLAVITDGVGMEKCLSWKEAIGFWLIRLVRWGWGLV